jgi:hypothetical protein
MSTQKCKKDEKVVTTQEALRPENAVAYPKNADSTLPTAAEVTNMS